MTVKSVPTLPVYPSSTTRKNLTASQLSTLQASISNALSAVLAVSGSIESSPLAASSLVFIQTYAQDHAFTALQALIWDNPPVKTHTEKTIHAKVLHLAQDLADHGLLNDLKLLVDLSIVYARASQSRVQKLFQTAVDAPGSTLAQDVKESLIPSFTQILETGQGLYNQRKTAECIYCFVLSSNYTGGTHSLLANFTQDATFLTALAQLYLPGLAATGRSYGGANALLSSLNNAETIPTDPTEWTSIYLTTKVTLLDSFHILFKRLLNDLASANGPRELAQRTETTFGALFAMMEVVAADTSSESSTLPTPFLNFSLLQDYQHTHDLSSMLTRALKKTEERDARLDILESALNSVAATEVKGKKNPGALKLLLRGSGLQRHSTKPGSSVPSAHYDPPTAADAAGSSSSIAANIEGEMELASKASQILDLLPDVSYEYVTQLLKSSKYTGNVERIIEALLDGSAPSDDALAKELTPPPPPPATVERRNVFDGEAVDFSSVRFGKKKLSEQVQGGSDPSDRLLREEMKADILRRVEIMDLSSDEELDADDIDPFALDTTTTTKQQLKTNAFAFDEDDEFDDDSAAIQIPGADSDDSDDDNSVEIITSGRDGAIKRVEAILELAYLNDPSVFSRDQTTRKSKERADLKSRTGWVDEQIEGWALVLERNPKKKDRLLMKHEFRGNRSSSPYHGQGEAGSSQQQQQQHGHRGGGGGGGRGRGRGGGGRGRAGVGGGDRAYKDKNKASHGNHSRKRGHDKKMASAGGPS